MKLKNTLQVMKINEPTARKTTERYHLTKKILVTNQLQGIVFKGHEGGTLIYRFWPGLKAKLLLINS